MNLLRPVLAALALGFGAPRLAAQLELPAERVAPSARTKSVDLGQPPRGDLAERVTGRKIHDRPAAGDGRLALPAERRAVGVPPAVAPTGVVPHDSAPAPAAGAALADPASGAPADGVAPARALESAGGSSAAAARFVLDEIAKVRNHDSTMVDHGVQSLLALGDAGRGAGFQALASEHAPSTVLGAKTLLGFADDAAREAVFQRLQSRPPAQAGPYLVDLLVALDPVHASPTWLAELLAHKQGPVRTAAQRHLSRRAGETPAAALLAPLRSKDADARQRAVSLLGQSEDPAAAGLLLEQLTDPSSSVGRRVVEALAARPEERIAVDLLRRALDAPWILREQSLALIALCDREDLRFETHLTDVHRARLLDGLTSADPFVSGACAAALVGIGYRGAGGGDTRWYDLEAPHRLVRIVSSQDFAPDLSTLAPTARRRLALVTGVDFGSDGPRWIEWWASRAESFRGARARLDTDPDSALRLELVVRSSLGAGDGFTLLGPAWADPNTPPRAVVGERYYLSEPQARGAFEELRRLGVLGVERLPGVRGSPSAAGRSLTIGLDRQEKSFRFTDAASAEWFEAALRLAQGLRSRNAWQALHDPRAAQSAEEFWRSESAWWDETAGESERARRLWDMTLERALSASNAQREVLVDRLEGYAVDVAPLRREDSEKLLALLELQPHLSARSQGLLRLALAGMTVEGVLPVEDAQAVVELLLDTFGAPAARQMASVMELAPLECALRSTDDARPFVRAVAATVLARRGGEEEARRLVGMLSDESAEVQCAVLLALGERKVEAAREELLIRARMGAGEVRLAALRACGLLGGEGALSALLAGLSDSEDPQVPVAAAQGIASLRDSGAAPILVSLLSRGAQDPCYEHARSGLLALGQTGVDELLRVVRSSSHRARREAALILSEQLVPQSASVLMTLLTEIPDDTRVAEELAVLTCVDFRADASPSASWWAWWEYVVRDDSQAWLCAALARMKLGAPSPEDVRRGAPAAVALLLELCSRDETYLVERARRELSRIAGRDLGRLPPRGRERELWIATLRDSMAAAKAR